MAYLRTAESRFSCLQGVVDCQQCSKQDSECGPSLDKMFEAQNIGSRTCLGCGVLPRLNARHNCDRNLQFMH